MVLVSLCAVLIFNWDVCLSALPQTAVVCPRDSVIVFPTSGMPSSCVISLTPSMFLKMCVCLHSCATLVFSSLFFLYSVPCALGKTSFRKIVRQQWCHRFYSWRINSYYLPMRPIIPNPWSPLPNPWSPLPNPCRPLPNPWRPLPNPWRPLPNPWRPLPNSWRPLPFLCLFLIILPHLVKSTIFFDILESEKYDCKVQVSPICSVTVVP